MYMGLAMQLTLGGQSGVIEWTKALRVGQVLEVYR